MASIDPGPHVHPSDDALLREGHLVFEEQRVTCSSKLHILVPLQGAPDWSTKLVCSKDCWKCNQNRAHFFASEASTYPLYTSRDLGLWEIR